MTLSHNITAGNAVAALAALVEDRGKMNAGIAGRMEGMTRDHLVARDRAAKLRTIARYGGGVSHTDYFAKMAGGLETTHDAATATLIFPTDGREAFARRDGDVKITPRAGHKYLTIPAVSRSYGKRAREFGALRFIPFPSGSKALAKQTITMVPGKRPGTQKRQVNTVVLFWLVPSVTLLKDDTILPTDEAYLNAAADEVSKAIEREAGATA